MSLQPGARPERPRIVINSAGCDQRTITRGLRGHWLRSSRVPALDPGADGFVRRVFRCSIRGPVGSFVACSALARAAGGFVRRGSKRRGSASIRRKHRTACMSLRLSRTQFLHRILINGPGVGFVRQLSYAWHEPAHPLQSDFGFVRQLLRASHEPVIPSRPPLASFGAFHIAACACRSGFSSPLPAIYCLLHGGFVSHAAIVDSNPPVTTAVSFGILDAN